MENNKLEVTESQLPARSIVPDISGRDISLPRRSEIQKLAGEDIIGAGADEVFGNLFQVLGSTDISRVHHMTPSEINNLTLELVLVRTAQDLLNGRADALKRYTMDTINLGLESDGKDATSESGYLYSPKYDLRLSKEVSGNKLNVDPDRLKKIVDDEQYNSIVNIVETTVITTYPDGRVTTSVNIVHEINEECLERELQKGNIGMEQIVQAAVPGKSRTAFYVRESK